MSVECFKDMYVRIINTIYYMSTYLTAYLIYGIKLIGSVHLLPYHINVKHLKYDNRKMCGMLEQPEYVWLNVFRVPNIEGVLMEFMPIVANEIFQFIHGKNC